jgi:methylamine dehydrogenase accessory protein MauD
MSGPWLVSYVVLWALVLFQGAVIFLLLRQLGVIYMGTAQGVSRDGLALGRRAPEFTAPDLAGRPISLSDFLGRPLLLIFGSVACAPCRTLIPDLNVFADERRDDLRALFLCRGSVEEARRFAHELDVRVPFAVHPDEELPEKYKARVTPFAFLIDGEGVVRAKGLANNRSHLDMLLEQAAKGYERPARRNGRNGVADHEPAAAHEEVS